MKHPLLLLVALGFFVAPARGPEVTIDHLAWSKDVDGPQPVRTLVVRNDHGDIRARRAEDRRLEVSAVVQRLDPSGEKVGFTVERRGSTIALTVSYPPGHRRDADPNPPKDAADRLDLSVFVPEGVALHAETLHGLVEARGLKSDVAAVSSEGHVFIATTGAIQAHAGSGPLTAVVGGGDGSRAHSLESDTGAITVRLVEGARLDVRATTGGEIRSSVRLVRRRHGGLTDARGSIGGGWRPLLISSRSGSIEIRPNE